MYRGETVGVVVPAHNEGAHVREVIETLPPLVDRAYVVDDGSTDDTWDQILAAVRAAPAGRGSEPTSTDGGTPAGDGGDPEATDDGQTPASERVSAVEDVTDPQDVAAPEGVADAGNVADDEHVAAAGRVAAADRPSAGSEEASAPVVVAVRQRENLGRGAAVKRGYRLAAADGMAVVAVMDGDGQMAPDQLERVVAPVATGRADYAKGNRLDGPEYWEGMSGWRLFGNLLLTGLTRVSSGYWGLRDPQNGYTAISLSTIEALELSELYDGYGFLNDLLGALSIADARVVDVPLPAVYGDEESGIHYSQFVPAVSALLLANFLRRLYVDGTRRRRVVVPAAYAVAGAGWLGAVVATLVGLVAGATSGALAPTAVGGPAVPLALAAAGGVATVVAVALDRRVNAVLETGETLAVDPG